MYDIFQLTYKVGIVTIPKIGKIFAFDTFEAAQKYFRLDSTNRYIFEASATGISYPEKEIPYSNADESIIKNYWKKKYCHDPLMGLQIAPNGTVFCETLTLIKNLKEPRFLKSVW